MKKHKHYQAIRAYADGWKIECLVTRTRWDPMSNPSFCEMAEYRIVPDEDGWIPWYPHEDAECPIEGAVDIRLACGEVKTFKIGYWLAEKSVTHYRPHKEKSKRERIKEILMHNGMYENFGLDAIMEIVEE